jgi:hypothetical protein
VTPTTSFPVIEAPRADSRGLRTCCLDFCNRAAQRDGLYCPEHLTDFWARREPAWRTWTREHGNAKDLSGSAA